MNEQWKSKIECVTKHWSDKTVRFPIDNSAVQAKQERRDDRIFSKMEVRRRCTQRKQCCREENRYGKSSN